MTPTRQTRRDFLKAMGAGAAALAEAGVKPQRLLAIPTPFNTLFWQVIAVEEDRHIHLYLPVLGSAETVPYAHPRNMDAGRCLEAGQSPDADHAWHWVLGLL